MFCGRHLLAAKLRRSNIDASAGALAEVERIVARIRTRCWPRVRILLRADLGFALRGLDGLVREEPGRLRVRARPNDRLVEEIAVELIQAEEEAARTGKPARRFKDLRLVDPGRVEPKAARDRQGERLSTNKETIVEPAQPQAAAALRNRA